jgi:cysteine dioxygenase
MNVKLLLMGTGSIQIKELPEAINDIIRNNSNFNEVTEVLFKYDYQDFEKMFQPEKAEIETGTYMRMPVYTGDCCVFLMLWGVNSITAIHDHRDYDGNVKILKGVLREVSYIPSDGFVRKGKEVTGSPGDELYVPHGAIHTVNNQASELSVSLHIYNTNEPGLEGVRIFDLEKRLIGVLNSKAKRSSWEIPESCFRVVRKV